MGGRALVVNVVELRKVEPGMTALASEQSIKAVPSNSIFSNLASRWFVAGLLATALVISSWIWIKDPLFARALAIAGICLVLWLTEVVPPYVPTLLLWAITPLLLSGYGEQFQLARVLGWSAHPVLALFLGGFALSVAASRHGIDNLIARVAVRLSGGHRLGLVALVIAATATLCQ